MFVKKFEGDTIDETLKSIKRELGPDAIILKTVTQKGLKSKLKKKIEITAAISEKEYVKKMEVDQVLGEEDKNQFYQSPANQIAQSIDQYSVSKQQNSSGYGHVGLNKQVKIKGHEESSTVSELDKFLGKMPEKMSPTVIAKQESFVNKPLESNQGFPSPKSEIKERVVDSGELEKIQSEMNKYKGMLVDLEKTVLELKKGADESSDAVEMSLKDLRTTLRCLEINERFIKDIIRKVKFELKDEEITDSDFMFEYLLRELSALIKTKLPKFSGVNENNSQVVTLILGGPGSGTSSMCLKIASMRDDFTLITFDKVSKEKEEANSFAKQVFKVKEHISSTISDVVMMARKAVENGENVIIDFKTDNKNPEGALQDIESLKRSFLNMEILLNVSAIQSKLYNRKMIKDCSRFIDGLIYSHVDQCLNYGQIFNSQINFDIPLLFFGNGPSIPDDIESATAERLLAEMFEL